MESTSSMRVSLAKHTLPVQGYSILPLIKKNYEKFVAVFQERYFST